MADAAAPITCAEAAAYNWRGVLSHPRRTLLPDFWAGRRQAGGRRS